MSSSGSKVENLFNDLREDKESVFYTTDQITRYLINKAKQSRYPKDTVFVNEISRAGISSNCSSSSSSNLPLTTPFILQKGNVDRSTFYSFTDQLFTFSRVLLRYCRQILLTFNFWLNQPWTLTIVFILLTCLLI